MPILRIIFKTILLLVILGLVIAGSLLAYLTLTDYQPEAVEKIDVQGKSGLMPGNHREFGFLTWNIGYCGMGKDMDFFYDGGHAVRPSLESYQKALNGVINIVNHADTLDFLLLQEVDVDARRSYYTNQVNLLSRNMPDFNFAFAKNYDVKFIPFPIFSPLAKIQAGLLTFSRFKTTSAERYSAPLNFSWPKRIFFLDRCFTELKIPLSKTTNIVVINLHNSAWDEGAILRVYELQLLRSKMLEEYAKGNYVIVGGDWNQNPPGFNKAKINNGEKVKISGGSIDSKLLPEGWRWVYDSSMITNRDADEPYQKGRTKTSTIDFYVTSPNVEVKEIKALDFGFEYSDHQPVYLRIKLKEDGSLVSPVPVPQ